MYDNGQMPRMVGNSLVLKNGGLLGIGNENTSSSQVLQTLLAQGVNYFTPEFKKKILEESITPITSTIMLTTNVGVSDTFNLVDTGLPEQKGLRTLRNGQLEKDRPFIVTQIQFLIGELPAGADPLDTKLQLTEYDTIDSNIIYKAIRSGTFEVQVDNKYKLQKLSMEKFANGHRTDQEKGLLELSRWFYIPDQKDIKATVLLGTSSGLTASTAVRVLFHGIGFTA